MAAQLNLIREYIVARLKQAPGFAHLEGRVFRSRRAPTAEDDLPCVLVYVDSETPEQEDEAPRTYVCTATLAVVCIARAGAKIDDELDDLLDAMDQVVRETLFGDNRLGKGDEALAMDSHYTGFDSATEDAGEYALGAIRSHWEIQYRDEAPDGKTQAPDNLERLNMKLDQHPQDGKTDVEADVELAQH